MFRKYAGFFPDKLKKERVYQSFIIFDRSTQRLLTTPHGHLPSIEIINEESYSDWKDIRSGHEDFLWIVKMMQEFEPGCETDEVRSMPERIAEHKKSLGGK